MARRATNVTRTRIQAVALALFRTRGYDATSLQQIASALDVTKAALYYHFPSKAELLHSLADPLLDGGCFHRTRWVIRQRGTAGLTWRASPRRRPTAPQQIVRLLGPTAY